MYPTIALVGRPNVGKSTLFNKLTRRRDALVANVPGLTRDRRYGLSEFNGLTCNLVDTGGLFGDHELAEALAEQTMLAVDEADLVIVMFDGREGVTPADEDVVGYLRKHDAQYLAVVNKIDGVSEDQIQAEFTRFGFSEMLLVSASHNRGIGPLQEAMVQRLRAMGQWSVDTPAPAVGPGTRVAVVGRPNVGKSTLVNRLIGERRQVVYDMPGTTRDAIDIPFSRDGHDYVLIDTAGVRRKGRVEGVSEKFSVVKALDAMRRAQVVVLTLDAHEGVVEQDLHVLQFALEAGCGIVVAVNKWDGLSEAHKEQVKRGVDRRFGFVPWIPVLRLSALHGTGVGHLLERVNRVYRAGEFDVSTSLLTRLVRNLVSAHPAPAVRGRQIKIKVATRAGNHPPTVVIHGNQLKALPSSYTRYLENGLREALDLLGNPVRLELRDAENPFASRRNQLTPRQQKKRSRVIQRSKKRK